MDSFKKPKKSIFGIIFGGLFFFSGLAIAFATIGLMAYAYYDTQDWLPVPAQIHELELKRNYGESTTYKVVASYSYNYGGINYHNTRVGLGTTSDNIGKYWQNLYSKLNNDKRRNQASAFVNPDNPNQAILDRTFRWENVAFGMMFVLTFCVVGGFIMWFSMKSDKHKHEELLKAQQGISSNEKHGYWFLFWFGSVFLGFGSMMAALILPDALREKEYAALFTLLFAVIGLIIVICAWRARQTYLRIGPTPLFLDPLPGSIGGHVGGHFDVGLINKQKPLLITLSCIQKRKSGDKTTSHIKWQNNMNAYCIETAKGTQARFLFECPSNQSATREWRNGSSIDWEIKADGWLASHTQSKPQEFSRSWTVPVDLSTQTATSNIVIPAKHLLEQEQEKIELAREEANEQIPIKQQGQYLTILSASGRGLGSAIAGFFIGLVFGVIGYYLRTEWWPAYLFLLIGIAVSVSCLFKAGRKIDVKIDTQIRMLYIRRSWFALQLYYREIALFDPKQFSIKKTSSTTSGSKQTEYFALYIDNNGKKTKVAEGVEGRRVADALLEKIIQQAFPNRASR